MVKTEDVPRQKAFPLNPTPPNPPPVEKEQGRAPGKPSSNRPTPLATWPWQNRRKKSARMTGKANQVRPRNLREARAHLPAGSQLPGPKMKQDGGCTGGETLRLDVQGSPFGDYDARLIYAVQKCWDDCSKAANSLASRPEK